eukprot:1148818-Pelagomonas_calceolata.AAC.2
MSPVWGARECPTHSFRSKRSTMSKMVTEHQNIASRIFLNGISKGPLVSGLATMDIGSADCLALQNLPIP